MSDIKILGKLAAGRADGILLDDKAIEGGYKVVQTVEERDALPAATLTVGTPVYVVSEGKNYRWNGTGFDEEVIDIPEIPEIPTVPTKVSELENDEGYITADDIPESSIIAVPTEADKPTADVTDGTICYVYSSSNFYKWADGAWVPSNNNCGFIVVQTENDKPTSDVDNGTLCYVYSTNTFYKWAAGAWSIHSFKSGGNVYVSSKTFDPSTTIIAKSDLKNSSNGVLADELILDASGNMFKITSYYNDNIMVTFLFNVATGGSSSGDSNSVPFYNGTLTITEGSYDQDATITGFDITKFDSSYGVKANVALYMNKTLTTGQFGISTITVNGTITLTVKRADTLKEFGWANSVLNVKEQGVLLGHYQQTNDGGNALILTKYIAVGGDIPTQNFVPPTYGLVWNSSVGKTPNALKTAGGTSIYKRIVPGKRYVVAAKNFATFASDTLDSGKTYYECSVEEREITVTNSAGNDVTVSGAVLNVVIPPRMIFVDGVPNSAFMHTYCQIVIDNDNKVITSVDAYAVFAYYDEFYTEVYDLNTNETYNTKPKIYEIREY